MLILDTNVISEVMRKEPNMRVVSWINSQPVTTLCTTWINIAEINRGIARLSDLDRKANLASNFSNFCSTVFKNRMFAFDQSSAMIFGTLCANREQKGLHIDPIDMMVASIAMHHKSTIATRNVKDFSQCGVNIVNPWEC